MLRACVPDNLQFEIYVFNAMIGRPRSERVVAYAEDRKAAQAIVEALSRRVYVHPMCCRPVRRTT